MDAKEQAAGERRVQMELIDPLMKLGLVRPSGMTVPLFDEMQQELRGKLAYMSSLSLQALAEQVAEKVRVGGKGRFPIALDVLGWAADIQKPEDSASPLIRAVFAHEVARTALAEDWAPELLGFVRLRRFFPKAPHIREIQAKAEQARDVIAKIDDRERQGFDLSADEVDFCRRRKAAEDRCRALIELAAQEGAA